MEKLSIVLVVIALVAGLGGGYGVGYVGYQSQVQSITEQVTILQNELRDLNSSIATVENELWQETSSIRDEVATVQNDLISIEYSITTIESRAWHEAYSIISSENVTSETFQLKGSSVRVSWTAGAFEPFAYVEIGLFFSNGTFYAVWGSSGVFNANNAVLELKQSGDYYLDIHTLKTAYMLTVWDYY